MSSIFVCMKPDDVENNMVSDDSELRSSSSAQLSAPKLPIPVFLWRIFLVVSVFLYSSFTIFVHLCEVDGKFPFRSTAVVFLVELLKLIISIIMYGIARNAWDCRSERNIVQAAVLEMRQNYQLSTATSLPKASTQSPAPPLTWKQLMIIILPFTVPAILYTINNNLAIFIQLEMDPATYQVLGNFKILSTAILFRLIIKRPIRPHQWLALFILLSAGFTHSYGSLLAKQSPKGDVVVDAQQSENSPSTFHLLHITPLGIGMIAMYCTISGLSGVYTEYVMKKRAQMSIHMQNGLLYLFGILLNGIMFIVEVYRDRDDISWNLFKGFTLWTWLLVITQAIVGISMGFVMKFSTNITRLFIISSAMLVTTFTAMLVFGLHLNALFILSFVLVSVSLYLYHV